MTLYRPAKQARARIDVPPLPRDPGPAAWNALLPPAAPAIELSENTSADWLVIGAGFAGLAAAKRLSQLRPEDRIVLKKELLSVTINTSKIKS